MGERRELTWKPENNSSLREERHAFTLPFACEVWTGEVASRHPSKSYTSKADGRPWPIPAAPQILVQKIPEHLTFGLVSVVKPQVPPLVRSLHSRAHHRLFASPGLLIPKNTVGHSFLRIYRLFVPLSSSNHSHPVSLILVAPSALQKQSGFQLFDRRYKSPDRQPLIKRPATSRVGLPFACQGYGGVLPGGTLVSTFPATPGKWVSTRRGKARITPHFTADSASHKLQKTLVRPRITLSFSLASPLPLL